MATYVSSRILCPVCKIDKNENVEMVLMLQSVYMVCPDCYTEYNRTKDKFRIPNPDGLYP